MSKDLRTFILNNKKFIRIKDGESFRGVYRGCQFGPSRFDPEKEVAAYLFWQPGMDEGKVARWEATSTRVAEDMENVSIGEEIEVSRKGSGPNDTKYTITAIGAEAPAPVATVAAAKKK